MEGARDGPRLAPPPPAPPCGQVTIVEGDPPCQYLSVRETRQLAACGCADIITDAHIIRAEETFCDQNQARQLICRCPLLLACVGLLFLPGPLLASCTIEWPVRTHTTLSANKWSARVEWPQSRSRPCTSQDGQTLLSAWPTGTHQAPRPCIRASHAHRQERAKTFGRLGSLGASAREDGPNVTQE